MKNKVMNQLRASKGTRCSQMAIIMWIEKRTIDTRTCKKAKMDKIMVLVHQVIGTTTTLTTSAEKENET